MNRYDYIIAGAGAAGLSLLMRMIASGHFNNKKILLIDKSPKILNDRTWCFWEKEPDIFEPIVYQSWKRMWFRDEANSFCSSIAPYSYKLIRGIDFYNFCFNAIRQRPNIDIRYGHVGRCYSSGQDTYIMLDEEKIFSEYIFSSIPPQPRQLQKREYHLLQHFRGWLIESESSAFNPLEATLMDFRTGQESGTTFVYVMPFTERTALVEYTLFSNSLLSDAGYDKGLREYLAAQLQVDRFTVLDQENGVIPMTNVVFPAADHHIVYLGTAGGQTKPSSGYTFRFIQKHSKAIVESLIKNGSPLGVKMPSRRRFGFYDSILLSILATGKLPGGEIFSRLFTANPMNLIMKFLDNETSVAEDIRIIRALPKKIFLNAAIREW